MQGRGICLAVAHQPSVQAAAAYSEDCFTEWTLASKLVHAWSGSDGSDPGNLAYRDLRTAFDAFLLDPLGTRGRTSDIPLAAQLVELSRAVVNLADEDLRAERVRNWLRTIQGSLSAPKMPKWTTAQDSGFLGEQRCLSRWQRGMILLWWYSCCMPRGNPSPKLAITVDPDVHTQVVAAAAAEGVSVSAWMTSAARRALRLREGLAAVAEWEAEHGALTAEEMEAARRRLPGGGAERRSA